MKIETKFNPGDRGWFFPNDRKNDIEEGTIKEISVAEKGKVSFSVEGDYGIIYSIPEKEFYTKDEIEAIKKQKIQEKIDELKGELNEMEEK